MTLVDAETGEVVPTITADEAREITDRIKVTVEGAWLLIKQAYEVRAWAALGYSSWDDYCTREFGTSRLKLPREERQEVVASLRDSGLSIRAIAAATGVNRETVSKDLQVAGNQPPEIEITGTDGKSYKPTTAERVKAAAKNNPPSDKVAKARKMAAEGYTSRQIGEAIGVKDMGGFRERHGIDVPADAVVGTRHHRHDSNRIMDELALAAVNVTAGSDLIDYSGLDADRIEEWIGSLSTAISSLTTIRRKIRELTR